MDCYRFDLLQHQFNRGLAENALIDNQPAIGEGNKRMTPRQPGGERTDRS